MDNTNAQLELFVNDMAKKPKGRTITVEHCGTRLPFTEYGISCEVHDAYIYLAKDIIEAVEKYEEDRDCRVGEVYNTQGDLLFVAHSDEDTGLFMR